MEKFPKKTKKIHFKPNAAFEICFRNNDAEFSVLLVGQNRVFPFSTSSFFCQFNELF